MKILAIRLINTKCKWMDTQNKMKILKRSTYKSK